VIKPNAHIKALIIAAFILPSLSVTILSQEEKPLVELSAFSYEKDRRQLAANDDVGAIRPVREVSEQNKYFQRKAREQQSPGATDPNTMTIDGRSAELDRIEQEAKERPRTKTVEGYTYHAKISNSYSQPTVVVFWEVKFTGGTDRKDAVRRQFVCPVKIKSTETKELAVFTPLGPGAIVDAAAPAAEAPAKPEISRVEFADGAVWQRLDWSYTDEIPKIKKALEKPWSLETCRVF
jgi:hypothetical protein